MKRKGVWLSLLLSGLTAWAACTASSSGGNQQANGGQAKMSEPTPSPSPQSRPYSTNLDELRAAFNRDKGKVRLVTLLSPT
jgi:ABC-type glycerol-3-phosphate transport system substrate-binding protein